LDFLGDRCGEKQGLSFLGLAFPCSAIVFASYLKNITKFTAAKIYSCHPGLISNGRCPFAGLPVPMKCSPG
jgi:hypothetical protein